LTCSFGTSFSTFFHSTPKADWTACSRISCAGAHPQKSIAENDVGEILSLDEHTERGEKTGKDVEHEIPNMKGYTVFNVEQIEGLPEIYYATAVPTRNPVARIDHAEELAPSGLHYTCGVISTLLITCFLLPALAVAQTAAAAMHSSRSWNILVDLITSSWGWDQV
jgi:hypothetical protein